MMSEGGAYQKSDWTSLLGTGHFENDSGYRYRLAVREEINWNK